MSEFSPRSLTPLRAARVHEPRAPRVIEIGSRSSLGYRALVTERQKVTLPAEPGGRRRPLRFLELTDTSEISDGVKVLEVFPEKVSSAEPVHSSSLPASNHFQWKMAAVVAGAIAFLGLAAGANSRTSPRRPAPVLSASNISAPKAQPLIAAVPVSLGMTQTSLPLEEAAQPVAVTEPAPPAIETVAPPVVLPPIAEGPVPELADVAPAPESVPSSVRPPLVRTNVQEQPILQLVRMTVDPSEVPVDPEPADAAPNRRPVAPEKTATKSGVRGSIHRHEYSNHRRGAVRSTGLTRQIREVLARVF